MRFYTDARTARFVLPIVNKLIADSPDGETCRMSLAGRFHTERPVIEYFRGSLSSLRVEGPWLRRDGLSFPMGALLSSPGISSHLSPIETIALCEQIGEAVEDAILHWIAVHDLQSLPPVDPRVNRAVDDPKAIACIEAWLAKNPSGMSDYWSADYD